MLSPVDSKNSQNYSPLAFMQVPHASGAWNEGLSSSLSEPLASLLSVDSLVGLISSHQVSMFSTLLYVTSFLNLAVDSLF